MRLRSSVVPRRYAAQKGVKSESGIAIVIVLFVVVLCTVMVTQLTYTGTLDTTLHLLSKRSLESEYLLKSAVNFGRAILKNDISEEDSEHDIWGPFLNGLEIPKELLQINDPSVKVEVEIRPEESKLPVKGLNERGALGIKWRDIFLRTFRKLEFDQDGLEDQSGLFPGRVFLADEVVANTIDFIDSNKDSYDDPNFASGIEANVPEDTFPNREINSIGDLYAIPGMNTDRVRRLSPFVTTYGPKTININFAPRLILESLHPQIGKDEVEQIIQFRAQQPFDRINLRSDLSLIITSGVFDEIRSLVGVESKYFQILAKVDYGASTIFMRAIVEQGRPNTLPKMVISEIFS